MATQVKGYPSGGSFTTITEDSAHRCSKSTTFGVTLTAGNQINALRAINMWHNTAGTGTLAAAAQKSAKAQGIQLQEV
jgi:hypothetical protein